MKNVNTDYGIYNTDQISFSHIINPLSAKLVLKFAFVGNCGSATKDPQLKMNKK